MSDSEIPQLFDPNTSPTTLNLMPSPTPNPTLVNLTPVDPTPVNSTPVESTPVSVPDSSGAIRMEAEALTLEGYKIDGNPKFGASGGQLISLRKNGSGKASGSFTGPEGMYQVKVGYYDENDGVSSATVKIASDSKSFLFDQDLPGKSPRPKTQTSLLTHEAIKLKSGQAFEISAQANLKEHARFDYIEFIPVDSSTPTPTPSPSGGNNGGNPTSLPLNPNVAPSGNFDLLDWKLTLPVDANQDGKADEIGELQLSDGFENSAYFYTSADGGMVFKAPVAGSKTSTNTKYTRSELREMLRRGDTRDSTKGVGGNNWVFSSAPSSAQNAAGGVDGELTATLAVNHVTTTGDSSQVGRVIIGQIHANDDEPLRIYYRKLPGNSKGSIYIAHEPLNGPEQKYEMIGSRSDRASNPADGIALDEKFSYKINVEGNALTVTILRPGKPDVVQTVDMTGSGFDSKDQYMYFKAGVYNQNNTGDPADYAQATFYALDNKHTDYSQPTSILTPISEPMPTPNPTPANFTAQDKPYKAAEILTTDTFQYGKVEFRMRAAEASGVISNFFTYKDNSEKPDTFWEEIDFEVFGKDGANSWQSNLITGGQGNSNLIRNERIHEQTGLASDYHTYTLEWKPNSIEWKVDGALVRSQADDTKDQAKDITSEATLRFNFWNPDIPQWVGEFDQSVLPLNMFVNWIKYYPLIGNDFADKPSWTDNFDNFDTTRWEKADWTFPDNQSDFTPDNANVKDGYLVLSMTKDGQTGYNGTPLTDVGEGIRINAGGDAFTDSRGNHWDADKYFKGGKTYTTTDNIGNIADNTLFQSERFQKNLAYAIPVENGNYRVNLHFDENYFSAAGKRVFDVSAEGALKLDDFDIYAAAGDKNQQVQKSFQVEVTDGFLNLDLNASVDNAKLSAIEVLKAIPEALPKPIQGSDWNKVFEDTFNDNSFDTSTWRHRTDKAYKRSAIEESNGTLKLHNAYDKNGVSTGAWIQSREEFKFGYFEADVHFERENNGKIWPTWWIWGGNSERDSKGNRIITTEFDLFEYSGFAAKYFNNKPTSTHHYRNKQELFPENESNAGIDPSTNFRDGTQPHKWGMLWTPWEVSFFYDGQKYMTSNHPEDAADPSEKLRLIFSTSPHLLVGPEGEPANPMGGPTPGEALPSFIIDNVQVWQRDSYFDLIGNAIRINAGGDAFTDNSGHVWDADKYFKGGQTYATAAGIGQTTDDTLFQSERFQKNLTYAIPLEAGDYTVNLDFAENYFDAAGKRVFDVSAEGALKLDNFDIYAAAGGKNQQVQKSFQVKVTDGFLNLDLNASIDNANLSAIEVLKATPEAPQTPPTPAAKPIRFEAEKMQLTGYRLESGSFASGGQFIGFRGGANNETGQATLKFSEPTGQYDVHVGYFDENDGFAKTAVEHNQKTLDDWTLDQQLGGDRASAATLTTRQIASGLQINAGDIFTLKGFEQGMAPNVEHARIDYIEFVPSALGTTASASIEAGVASLP